MAVEPVRVRVSPQSSRYRIVLFAHKRSLHRHTSSSLLRSFALAQLTLRTLCSVWHCPTMIPSKPAAQHVNRHRRKMLIVASQATPSKTTTTLGAAHCPFAADTLQTITTVAKASSPQNSSVSNARCCRKMLIVCLRRRAPKRSDCRKGAIVAK